MTLPVEPPVAPMLAKPSRELPEGQGLSYEPKWDGFRCIAYRDGERLELASRDQKPLARYFPELLEPLRQALPQRCVVDGEVVIARPQGLDFDALLQRIHPAESRIRRLARDSPAEMVLFDLLALEQEDLRQTGFGERSRLLRAMGLRVDGGVHLTPSTTDIGVARDWFTRFEGAGLDGIVVKDQATPYLEGKRAMIKVKHQRTADCVVGGYRLREGEQAVGSFLLGLYDQKQRLQHVGVTSSFTARRRTELLDELARYRLPPGSAHPWTGAPEDGASRRPGGPSRWSSGRDLSFEPLRPELVCEVAYDHLQADRFRHATTFLRWRPDRSPGSCTYGQLEVAAPFELRQIFRGAASD